MTAHSYLSGVKRILRFEDIEIINEKLKAKVNLPPMYPQVSDRIPTIEEFQRMLNVANLCGKTMLTMLASSGMRIGEALSLKVGSILFERPTRIVLKPSETKTWRGRGVMAHF